MRPRCGRREMTAGAAVLAWTLGLGVPATAIGAPGLGAEPKTATLPLLVDHNRITVAVEFRRADGAVQVARAWVDGGGTDVILAEPLARRLGIDMPLPAGEHSVATTSPVPLMRIGGIALDTEGMNVSVRAGRFARPGVQADCVLPARCLRRLHVVFDYPARRLTVARPGVLRPRGTAVPCRINPETGLIMVDTTIDGEPVALGVDNGSAGTWVSEKLTAAWLARHTDWPQAAGAAGSTNFFGFPRETRGTLLSLPSMAIGSMPVHEIAVLGLDQALFDWYSEKSAAAVAGFLGGDVIARFRLEVDFPGQRCWWQPGSPRKARDLDIVGLTLRADGDGGYTVVGVVSRQGRSTLSGVQPDDRLIRVDGLEVMNAPMGAVVDALRGKPGATRALLIERGGKRIAVRATVVRLP